MSPKAEREFISNFGMLLIKSEAVLDRHSQEYFLEKSNWRLQNSIKEDIWSKNTEFDFLPVKEQICGNSFTQLEEPIGQLPETLKCLFLEQCARDFCDTFCDVTKKTKVSQIVDLRKSWRIFTSDYELLYFRERFKGSPALNEIPTILHFLAARGRGTDLKMLREALLKPTPKQNIHIHLLNRTIQNISERIFEPDTFCKDSENYYRQFQRKFEIEHFGKFVGISCDEVLFITSDLTNSEKEMADYQRRYGPVRVYIRKIGTPIKTATGPLKAFGEKVIRQGRAGVEENNTTGKSPLD